MSPNRRAVLASTPALLFALSACSTGSTAADSSSGADTGAGEVEEDAFPATITHAFGETVIEKEATKVVTVGWSDHDSVAALGVVPIAAPLVTWGGNEGKSTDYFDAQLKELGAKPSDVERYDDADGIPVDEIAALAPDLILGVNSGMTEQEYKKLSKIAPTVAYPEGPWATPWEEQTVTIGEALGRKTAAQALVDDTNAAIDEAVAKYPEIEGKTVAWLWFTPGDLSSVGLYTSEDLRPQLLRRFGMKDAPIIGTMSEPGEGSYSVTVSAEKADTIDSDVAIFYLETPGDLKKITGDDLLGQIPAIKSEHYVASADNQAANPMSSPSPLAIPFALEEFLPKIAKAAGGEPVQ